jgi:hypothetical protein
MSWCAQLRAALSGAPLEARPEQSRRAPFEEWDLVDMQVAQFFIVVIGWVIFPAFAIALLCATFVFFRQDDSPSHLNPKPPTVTSR